MPIVIHSKLSVWNQVVCNYTRSLYYVKYLGSLFNHSFKIFNISGRSLPYEKFSWWKPKVGDPELYSIQFVITPLFSAHVLMSLIVLSQTPPLLFYTKFQYWGVFNRQQVGGIELSIIPYCVRFVLLDNSRII